MPGTSRATGAGEAQRLGLLAGPRLHCARAGPLRFRRVTHPMHNRSTPGVIALHGPVQFGCAPSMSSMPTSASKRVQLVIDEDLQARIKALAKAHRRSTSSEICVAIEAWVRQHQADESYLAAVALTATTDQALTTLAIEAEHAEP